LRDHFEAGKEGKIRKGWKRDKKERDRRKYPQKKIIVTALVIEYYYAY